MLFGGYFIIGIRSGILRTICYDCDVEFRNGFKILEFVVIFWRSNQQEEIVTIKSNQEAGKVTIKSNYHEEKVTIRSIGMPLSMRQKYIEADSYTSAIRNAIFLGGDADTMACMAGGIAVATKGMEMPEELARSVYNNVLDDNLRQILNEFNRGY